MSEFLYVGLALFCLLHMATVAFHSQRKTLIGKIGPQKYKGSFAILTLFSFGMLIYGWRSSEFIYVFDPTPWDYRLAYILMFGSLFLFGASSMDSNIKRCIRHPQLTAVILWGVAHSLANGDKRSLILFMSLTTWAVIEIFLINKRDGARQKPEAVSYAKDLKLGLITAVIYFVLAYLHVYFTGVALI